MKTTSTGANNGFKLEDFLLKTSAATQIREKRLFVAEVRIEIFKMGQILLSHREHDVFDRLVGRLQLEA